MQKNKKMDQLISVMTVLLVAVSVFFFLKDQLALAFLGSHPIEMSFRRAIVIDSENAAYPFALGVLRERLARDIQEPIRRKQRYQDALNAIQKAVDLNPYRLSYRTAYAELASKVGFYDEGKKVLSVEGLPFDFELELARAFYDFRRASQVSDAQEKNALLKQGIESYRRARRIAGQFAEEIFKRRVTTLPADILEEINK